MMNQDTACKKDTPLVFPGENDREGVLQPDSFRLCPLGVQLYTPTPVEECKLIELTVTVRQEDGAEEHIDVVGIVAQCSFSKKEAQYRLWVKFLDLPERVARYLKKLSKHNGFICPQCRNF